MKTKALLIAAFATVISFASCKKDYTCRCTFDYYDNTSSPQGELVSSGSTELYIGVTKSDAKDACNQEEADLKNETGTGYMNIECDIKKN